MMIASVARASAPPATVRAVTQTVGTPLVAALVDGRGEPALAQPGAHEHRGCQQRIARSQDARRRSARRRPARARLRRRPPRRWPPRCPTATRRARCARRRDGCAGRHYRPRVPCAQRSPSPTLSRCSSRPRRTASRLSATSSLRYTCLRCVLTGVHRHEHLGGDLRVGHHRREEAKHSELAVAQRLEEERAPCTVVALSLLEGREQLAGERAVARALPDAAPEQ